MALYSSRVQHIQRFAGRLSEASRQSLACGLDTVYTMYHKQTPTHGEYHYKQYMQVCALYKPQARLCLLASDNLPAKRYIQNEQISQNPRIF